MYRDFTEKLIQRLKIEFAMQDRSGVYGLTQRNMSYNSNRIEGSTLTIEQTASLFDTGTLKSGEEIIRAKDIEEMTGHFLMFNEMLKTFEDELNSELIKKYHYHLKSGVFEDMVNGYPVGEYKNRANIVGNIVTSKPGMVEKDMEDLLKWYHSGKFNLEHLAEFHSRFEMIHPFQDGNGRVGRMILFKECLKNNVPPFIITDENKNDYYYFLNESQRNGEYKKLADYFRSEQSDYFHLVCDMVIPYRELSDFAKTEEGRKNITAAPAKEAAGKERE